MIRLTTALREHRDAGPLSDRIPLWAFVDAQTLLTKAGSVALGFRLHGVDPECLDHPERRAIVRRLEQALRQLDDQVRVYAYLLKRPAARLLPTPHAHPVVRNALASRASYFAARVDRLYDVELVVILLYEGQIARPSRLARVRALWESPHLALAEGRSQAVLAEQLSADLAHLHHQAEAFQTQLDDVLAPTALDRHALFQFFRDVVHGPADLPPARLKYDTDLDCSLMDASIECHRTHLAIGDVRVKVLTMKEPPARTFAGILDELWSVPASLTVCLEWRRLPHERVRRDIQARRRHFFNRRVALINYLQSSTRPEEMLVDPSAGATVDELGQALTDLEVSGHVFGECGLTVLVSDADRHRVDTAATACLKAMALHDGTLHDETYNRFNAWLALLPGNAPYNVRRLTLLETHAADLAPVYAPASGERRTSEPDVRDTLAVFETRQHSRFDWPRQYHDVGHLLVQGATGSGKSFLVNFLLTHAQQYDPVTVIFDLGGSYDRLTAQLGGGRWRIGLSNQDVAINPFALPPTPEHRHFLQAFVRVLLESGGAPRLSAGEDRELEDAVESLYVLDAPQRRLGTLAQTLPRVLGERLQRWTGRGAYGQWFDHEQDTLEMQTFGCFDFEGLDQYPAVLEPLLFYALHRTSVAIRDNAAAGRLTICVVDEAWRFVRDPTVKAYLTEALKTWRKRQAALWLITQGSADFGDGDLLRTVLESCPTKAFLANPGADPERLRQLFHLNETEASLVQTLLPRREVLLKRPDLAKVLQLVDPFLERLFTTPITSC